MKIGSHVSLKEPLMYLGSVQEALSYNATAFMVYTGAPQNTFRKPLSELHIPEAKELIKKHQLEVIVHAPYIINLASPDYVKREFAINFLKEEMKRSDELGAKYIVVHPGSYTESSLEEGIKNAILSINEVMKTKYNVLLCIETMSGKGSEICYKFEQIKQMIDNINYPVGVCLDSCHIHDAGYDLINNYEGVFQEFDRIVGLDKIKVIHLNDSKNMRGDKKDRHANIGDGNIGFDILYRLAHDKRFIDISKILETPYINDLPPYKDEIFKIIG